MFSLESPHRGDFNEYTQYTIFNIKKKNMLNNSKFMQLLDFLLGNKPSVFEPLKFYCNRILHHAHALNGNGNQYKIKDDTL